jgi:hypothetical protein
MGTAMGTTLLKERMDMGMPRGVWGVGLRVWAWVQMRVEACKGAGSEVVGRGGCDEDGW